MSKLIVNPIEELNGVVNISGSKNAALPLLSASLLADGKTVINNLPDLSDISVMVEILEMLGCKICRQDERITVDPSLVSPRLLPIDLTGKIRASFLVAGPLLARFGKADVALPGGCTIGTRPVDLHLKGFKALGADYVINDGYVSLFANKLKGTRIYLDFPSVGATQNIMMASCFAEGTTIIENCASEPEIVNLSDFINKCGGKISGAGTDKITVDGVGFLKGTEFDVIPDRIEAGTYMIATAVCGGNVTISGVDSSHLTSVTSKLTEIGISVTENKDTLIINAKGNKKSTDIKTMPFPGFPTDMQSQFASLLCNIEGTSVITETIFENRFMYVPELVRMNADIKVDGRTAVICGKGKLVGAEVTATDLRAGAALLIAGLSAKGKSVINKAEYLNRGYNNICEKFAGLGANMYFDE